MSKLQRALRKLRDREDTRTDTSASADRQPIVARDAPNAVVGNRHDRRDRQNTDSRAETQAHAFSAPEFSIEVDVELLCKSGLLASDEYDDLIAQQFRRIKRPVLNNAFGLGVTESKNANVVMLASALPKTGKTFCSINLAASIARERDYGAVLVDADVLKPNISKSLGLEDRIGLIDFLLDPKIRLDDILVATDLFDIVVVPAGKRHGEATELLASRLMQSFIMQLSARFSDRAVIFDTPPLLLTSEANVLAEHMGQIILVIEAGVSTHESVSQSFSSLNRGKPINAILNKAHGMNFAEIGGTEYGYYFDRDRLRENE